MCVTCHPDRQSEFVPPYHVKAPGANPFWWVVDINGIAVGGMGLKTREEAESYCESRNAKARAEHESSGWVSLLRRYRIKNICDDPRGGWIVESVSGKRYRVDSYTPRNPDSAEFAMRCDCPARKRCRHIDAVMAMRYAEELAAAQAGDWDGIEIIERTEV